MDSILKILAQLSLLNIFLFVLYTDTYKLSYKFAHANYCFCASIRPYSLLTTSAGLLLAAFHTCPSTVSKTTATAAVITPANSHQGMFVR